MQIIVMEDNPITGVRYGVVEAPQYNNNTQRHLDRYYRIRNKLAQQRNHHTNNTKHK